MSKGLEYIKGKIADLEDDLQHYTMVDKDKAKEFFIKCELEELHSLEKELQVLETIRQSNKQFKEVQIGTGYGLTIYVDINNKEQFDLVKEGLENE